MRVYRIFNATDHVLATHLHFLDRHAAQKYADTVRWPYENLGLYPCADGRHIPLKDLELRIESAEHPGAYDPDLDCVITERHGELGRSDVIPGLCFDPDDFRPFTPAEWMDEKMAPKLEAIEAAMREQLKLSNFIKDRWKERGAKEE